jgi:hypothetical protein
MTFVIAQKLKETSSMTGLIWCNKFSCEMGVLTRPDGQDAHPTTAKF